MTVFLMSIAYGILKAGCFIILVVKGYKGWTLFVRNNDDILYIIRSRSLYQRRFIRNVSGNASEPAKPVLPAASPARPASTDNPKW